MKVLLKKIKRSNKIALAIYIISLLLFIGNYIYFTSNIIKLEGIETFIRMVILILFALWFFIYTLFGLTTLLTKKLKKFLVLTIFNLVLFIVMLVAAIIIQRLYGKLEMFSNKEYTLYTTNLIALKDTEIDSYSKLGMVSNNEDIEGYVLANTLKNKENLNQEVEYFDDYYSMLNALYNKEIAAAFVSSNYIILFSSEEMYENIGEETKVLYEYSEQMKSKTISNTNKKLTEPFTVLLMGVDSSQKGLDANAAFNGDTLMLITFNPQTLNATMLSIPRDTFVPIACNNNRSHKINSAAAYGTECVINTVKNLVDVDIDYYAKINFRGVMGLVDALGGIDIEVEAPNYSAYIKRYGEGILCESNYVRDDTHPTCMGTGWQHLDGEQALAYARNRHGYLESDLARNRHQQQIVEAVAKKLMTINSFGDFENLLDVIGMNIATNLSTTQMLSFYQTLKNMLMQSLKGNDFITIQKTYLEVYTLPVMLGDLQLSALGYYDNSLKEIQKAMKVNLGLQEEEMIKTFSYDYNEDYTSPIIGKGVMGGIKEETVPNLIGSTVRYAEDWAASNGIAIEKSFRCSDGIPGVIGDQSVSIGTFVRSISSITVYINQACNNTTTIPNTGNNGENTTTTPNPNNPSKEDENKENTANPIEPIPGGPTTDDNSNNDKPNKEETSEENKENDKTPDTDKDKEENHEPSITNPDLGGPSNSTQEKEET